MKNVPQWFFPIYIYLFLFLHWPMVVSRCIVECILCIFLDPLYLKQRQEDIMTLVFKQLNLCPVIPASRGVNPLATSHTAEHLSSICLQKWSHDNQSSAWFFIALMKRHCLEPLITIKKLFLILEFFLIISGFILEM